MAPALTQAERLRRHREIFQRAMHDNVTLAEAEKRIALEEIDLRQRAIDAIRAGGPVHGARPVHRPAEQRPTPWYQKDQYE